jgi:hypothetical protein
MISDSHCSLTDTLCVDLHSFPSISPEYPKLIFFDRGQNATDYIRPQIELISNLISNDDECIILSNAGINSVMNYYWMDITGSIVFQSSIEIPEGIQRMNLSCPMQNGMYFLFYEINGQSGYKRICVMK